MDSFHWDSCPVYQKRGEGQKKKKSPKRSAKRTARLQKGAEIRFYTQAPIFARAGWRNEWHLL